MVTSVLPESERFLFLDIDGVVNTLMIYDKSIDGRRMNENDGYFFDLCWPVDKRVSNEYAVRWLSKLCVEYNLKIVITSTWLIGHKVKDIEECLRNSGLDKRIVVYDGAIYSQFKGRGVQIEHWLYNKGYNPDNLVMIILDDDSDMVGFKRDYTEYLVQCNTHVGFGLVEYSKACSLLDKLIDEREVFKYGKTEE